MGVIPVAIGRLGALVQRLRHRLVEFGNGAESLTGTSDTRHEVLVVHLQPSRAPLNEVERCVYATLARGPQPLDTLVDCVAEQLLRTQIARGGWISDIGVWGTALWRSEALRVILALDGSMLLFEPPLARLEERQR
jgi:hypothetical protein